MIHHIKETADGVLGFLSGLCFFTISAASVDMTMKVVSFLLGSIVSILASIYYIKAIRGQKKSRK
jgi:hypothetical protein